MWNKRHQRLALAVGVAATILAAGTVARATTFKKYPPKDIGLGVP